jgi:hypothetical protein
VPIIWDRPGDRDADRSADIVDGEDGVSGLRWTHARKSA